MKTHQLKGATDEGLDVELVVVRVPRETLVPDGIPAEVRLKVTTVLCGTAEVTKNRAEHLGEWHTVIDEADTDLTYIAN